VTPDNRRRDPRTFGGYAPGALQEIAGSWRLSGVVVRPLNVTVRRQLCGLAG
jgi:hypothetical protein